MFHIPTERKLAESSEEFVALAVTLLVYGVTKCAHGYGFGGQANAEDLAEMGRLLGEVEVREISESYSRWGERSSTVSTRTRPILEPARLRTLPFGTAVLLLRSAPPIMLKLTRWTDRADGKRLAADRDRLEDTVRAAAAAR